MKTILKLAVFACVVLTALALAGSAFATQKLEVSQSGTSLTIKVSQAQTDPQPAKITIYVPTGYVINTDAAPGSKIGTTQGEVFARDLNIPLPLAGDVVVAPPSTNAPGCATGTHLAVWILDLTVAGQHVQLPVHVDPTTGPESSIGAYKMVICLGPADVPAGTPGRSPNGAQLLSATFTTSGVFTVPQAPAVWKTITTPYTAGSPAPNAAGTVETRSVIGPGSITLRAKVNKKTRRVTLSGVVRQAGVAVSGAAVRITANNRAVRNGTVRTKASGAFTLTLRKTTRRVVTTFFQARVTAAARDITSTGCASPTQPPVPCVSATAGGFTATSAKIRVRL
jgi:hypothetical protein